MERADQRLVPSQRGLRPVVANVEARLAEVKSRFFSTAAHELRTPLTTIVGYLEMLLDEEFGPLSESQRESLEIVSESARQLRAVTNNMLIAARLEAGRVKLDRRPIDLFVLVKTVAAGFASQLKAKAQYLELRVSPDLPPALCDEEKAIQIIRNLLNYMCECTPEGGAICIAVAPAAEKGFLQIEVSGTGANLDSRDIVEMTKSLSTREIGLIEADAANLGPCVACALVELHGGCVWSKGASEGGGSFCVTLPSADEPR
jgi:two-component system cell cycle sensor histidine kinase PleC